MPTEGDEPLDRTLVVCPEGCIGPQRRQFRWVEAADDSVGTLRHCPYCGSKVVEADGRPAPNTTAMNDTSGGDRITINDAASVGRDDFRIDLDSALRERAVATADDLEAITGEPYTAAEALAKGLDLLEAKIERFAPAGEDQDRDRDDDLRADGGQVEVCPECGSTQVQTKVKTGKPHREHPEPYYCGKTGCYAHFEEPATVDAVDAPGGGTLAVCPVCDCHEIILRTGKTHPDVEPGTWRCQNPECGAVVSEPARRPRHNPGGEPGPLGQVLAEADPDADFEDLRSDDPEPVTDGGADYPQPAIGDLVTYVDGEGERHRAVVIDGCPNDPYVTVVTGAQGELGIEYNHDVDAHASTFPHTSVWGPRGDETYAFIPGWDK